MVVGMAHTDTQRDREMILDPYRWPYLYLPLKRNVEGSGWPEVGLLTTAAFNADAAFRVERGMTIFGSPVGERETITYDGVDELLAAGWRVD